MASYSPRAVEKLICFLVVSSISPILSAYVPGNGFAPEFNSLEQISVIDSLVRDEDYKKVLFEVRGRNIYNGMQIKVTKDKSEKNTECENFLVSYNVSELSTDEFKTARYELTVPNSVQGIVYLCLPHQVKENSELIPPSIFESDFFKWYHQGSNVTLNLTSSESRLKL